jgi:Protein of unknown function (DUF2796)
MRLILATTLFVCLFAAAAFAEEAHRQLGAHVHGESHLAIALEGNKLSMELTSPAADIVGFEYEPSSGEEKAAMEEAKGVLSSPLDLFVMPSGAGCTVSSARVEHVLEEHHDEEDGEYYMDDGEHAGAHAAAEDHQDGHEHDEGMHSEFHASYELNCQEPARLDRIEFGFFDKFPNAQIVDVQAIGDAGQAGFEVERAKPVISLTGVTG